MSQGPASPPASVPEPAAPDILRAVLEQAPAVVIAIDLAGVYTFAAGRPLTALGMTPEDLLGRTAREVFGPDSPQAAAHARALAGEDVQVAMTHRGRDFEGRYTPQRDPAGQVRGALGVVVDVTDARRAEQERQRLAVKVEQARKLESLAILAGGIAHEFNNLLTAVLGYTTLAVQVAASAGQREHLTQVERAAQRAADLCLQMLAYSGRGQFVLRPVDLSRLIEEMAPLLRASAPWPAEVHLDLADGLPAVVADATQLRQVVMNLLGNAHEALDGRPGSLTLRTARRWCTHDDLSRTFTDDDLPEGVYVGLEVEDTGCGMDESTRRRACEPFFSTKFTGRGLGLPAALGIVRGHRGALRLESEVGRGTTVRVYLPAQAAPASARPEPVPTQGRLVLLADDEPGVRGLAEVILRQAGFEVLAATDGREALDLFATRANEVTLLVLDLTMPHKSGAEVFHVVRQHRPDVPVLLSSGYGEEEATRPFAGATRLAFLQKPYRPPDLLAAVQGLLSIPD